MEALKAAAKDDPRAWHDYKSPDQRTYWWNEARNSSGALGCWSAGVLGCAAAREQHCGLAAHVAAWLGYGVG